MSAESLANPASGPYLAVCLLLAVAGTAKVTRPGATRAAAHALHLPSSAAAVRALGGIEILVAVSGAVVGGLAALAVTAAYASLAIVAWRLAHHAPGTPCGCLGGSTTAVSARHVALNGGAAAIALLAAFGRAPVAAIADQPLAGIPFIALVGCCAWLAALAVDAGRPQPAANGGTPR